MLGDMVSPFAHAAVGHALGPAGSLAMGLGKLAAAGKQNRVTNLLIDRLLNPDEASAPLNGAIAPGAPFSSVLGRQGAPIGIGWKNLLMNAGKQTQPAPQIR